ncbi:MAG: GrpB family protein [Clostridia bacterium]
MRRTEVVAWSEKWRDAYLQESQALRKIFLDELVDIHHIGSTAVQAIGFAKPIIDILIVVKDIQQVDRKNGEMALLGYEAKGEYGIEGRRFFIKGGDQRSHHVHIYQEGHDQIDAHLQFRDYLRHHPDDAQAYGELKVKLAQQYPVDVPLYQQGKDAFCKELTRKAMRWAADQRNS